MSKPAVKWYLTLEAHLNSDLPQPMCSKATALVAAMQDDCTER